MQPHSHRNVFLVRCQPMENGRLRWMRSQATPHDAGAAAASEAAALPVPPTHAPSGKTDRRRGRVADGDLAAFVERWTTRMTDAQRVQEMFAANFRPEMLPARRADAVEALRRLGVDAPRDVLRAL